MSSAVSMLPAVFSHAHRRGRNGIGPEKEEGNASKPANPPAMSMSECLNEHPSIEKKYEE